MSPSKLKLSAKPMAGPSVSASSPALTSDAADVSPAGACFVSAAPSTGAAAGGGGSDFVAATGSPVCGCCDAVLAAAAGWSAGVGLWTDCEPEVALPVRAESDIVWMPKRKQWHVPGRESYHPVQHKLRQDRHTLAMARALRPPTLCRRLCTIHARKIVGPCHLLRGVQIATARVSFLQARRTRRSYFVLRVCSK